MGILKVDAQPSQQGGRTWAEAEAAVEAAALAARAAHSAPAAAAQAAAVGRASRPGGAVDTAARHLQAPHGAAAPAAHRALREWHHHTVARGARAACGASPCLALGRVPGTTEPATTVADTAEGTAATTTVTTAPPLGGEAAAVSLAPSYWCWRCLCLWLPFRPLACASRREAPTPRRHRTPQELSLTSTTRTAATPARHAKSSPPQTALSPRSGSTTKQTGSRTRTPSSQRCAASTR